MSFSLVEWSWLAVVSFLKIHKCTNVNHYMHKHALSWDLMQWAGIWRTALGFDALSWDLMHWAGIWCTALGSDAPSWDLMHWAGIWYTELGSDALSLVNASATYSCMVVAVPVYMSSLPLSLCAMCVCMFYCSFRALLICVWAHVCMHAHACVHMAYVCMIEQC